MNLRNTPELIFKLDDSVEYAVRMSQLIDQISQKDEANEAGEADE